jgi:WD40 repeat protein
MSSDSFKEFDKAFSDQLTEIEEYLNTNFPESGNSNDVNCENEIVQIEKDVQEILEIVTKANNGAPENVNKKNIEEPVPEPPSIIKCDDQIQILASCAISETEVVFGLEMSQLRLYSLNLSNYKFEEKAKFSDKEYESENINFMQYIKDKRLLIVGYIGGNLRVFEIKPNAIIQKGRNQKFNHSESIMNIQYLQTSKKILTCSYADSKRKDQNIKLWDIKSNNDDITISFLNRYQEDQYSANSAAEIPAEKVVVIALSTTVRGKLMFYKIKEETLEKIECQNQYKVLAKNGLYWLQDTQVAVLGEEFLSIISFKNNQIISTKKIENNKINTNDMAVSFALYNKSYLIFTSSNTLSITSLNNYVSKESNPKDIICIGNCCIFLKNGYLLVDLKKGFAAFKIKYDF